MAQPVDAPGEDAIPQVVASSSPLGGEQATPENIGSNQAASAEPHGDGDFVDQAIVSTVRPCRDRAGIAGGGGWDVGVFSDSRPR